MKYLSLIASLYLTYALFLLPVKADLIGETFVFETPEPTLASVHLDNSNWFSAPHPKVASFTMFADGSAEGVTEDGIVFSQYNIPNTLGIRVQRFEIQDHYHYIVEGVVVDSFEDLSAKLALAYHAQSETSV